VNEPPHPLSEPLPPDVAAGESTFIRYYQKYTVFSWPWAWRRTALFGALGALAGISFGASHGLFVHDLGEAIAVSAACSLANLVLIGAGPVLAAFFRHRAWRLPLERTLIVAAILLGIVLGVMADDWANRVHDAYMAAHGYHANDTGPTMEPAMDTHMLVNRVLEVSKDLLILLIISGGFALPAYFSERRRWAEHRRRVALEKISLEKSEADLKLTVLQAQVEPHFLFNTLASVRSLVTTDPTRASQTIDALAQHLRATLPKLRADTGVTRSTLGEQFAICASYLDLMKLRMGDRLGVELELPPDLVDAPFPPLLLISLVENAIKHGVEPKPGLTKVRLAARALERDRLEVSVEDDGAGLTLGMGEGTGLANIRAQLLTRFGAEASLELSARDRGGVQARIVVPRETRP
jgi:signal transduction histidine kinase